MLGDVDRTIEDIKQVPEHYLNRRVKELLIDMVETLGDFYERIVVLEQKTEGFATRPHKTAWWAKSIRERKAP